MKDEVYVIIAEDEFGRYLVNLNTANELDERHLCSYGEAVLHFDVLAKQQHTDYRIGKIVWEE